MAHVVYAGPSDRYELSAADWKALGVEGASKTVFEKDESYEVEDNVLDILLNSGRVSGFKELSDQQVARLLGEEASEDEGTPDSSSLQTGTDAATTGTTTTTAGRASRGGRGAAATSKSS